MKRVVWSLLFVATMAVLPAHAEEKTAAALFEPCAYCHGSDAEGNVLTGAPALAGQHSAYLERQLRHFRSGVRGSDPADVQGSQMKPMAAALEEGEITRLAGYLSELPMPVVTPAADADLKNGNNYYQSKCGACHGGRAQGNPALHSPALSGLDAQYLRRQMQNFQRGLRGTHPDDTYGRQMKMMSTALPEEADLDDVIAYIHSLGAAR